MPHLEFDEVHGFRHLQFSVCCDCKNPLPFSVSANCANWTQVFMEILFWQMDDNISKVVKTMLIICGGSFRMRGSFWLIPSDDRKVSMRSVNISEFWRNKYGNFRNRMEGWRVDWETLNYEIHWRLVIDGWDNVREFCSLLASWDPRKRRGKRAEKGRNRNLILDGKRWTLCSHLLV